jgi:hypothetical protein
MKRRLTISITFALFVLAVVAAFHQRGHGQTGNNVRQSSINGGGSAWVYLNSGLIPLNQNQFVRLSLANATTNPNASDRRTARVNVRILQYAPSGQQGAVMKHAVVGQTSSGPIIMPPGEGASMDFDLTQAVRADVQGFYITVEALPFAGSNNNAACIATLTIYDKLTNQPLSIWVWAEADGGYVWM